MALPTKLQLHDGTTSSPYAHWNGKRFHVTPSHSSAMPATAKAGTVQMTAVVVVTVPSNAPPRRHAATSPSAVPIANATIGAVPTSARENGRDSRTDVPTPGAEKPRVRRKWPYPLQNEPVGGGATSLPFHASRGRANATVPETQSSSR